MKQKIFGILTIVIFGLFLYTFTIRGSIGNFSADHIWNHLSGTGQPFESSHERSPYALLLSLVNNHTFALTQDLADLGAPDVGFYNNKFYSYFPPGVSIVAIPFYLIGRTFNVEQLAVFASIAIFSILALIFLFLICIDVFEFPFLISLLGVFIFAAGTTALSYSTTIYQHLPSVFFLLSAFYFAYKFKKSTKIPFVWASVSFFLCGISIFFDYPNMFFVLPILSYLGLSAFKRVKNSDQIILDFKISVVFASFFFAACLGILLYSNQVIYGTPFALSNSFPRYERGKLQVLKDKIQVTKTLDRGKLKLTTTFQEELFPHGLFTLTVADDKGIFIFSPILVLGLLGMANALRKKGIEAAILVAIMCLNFFLYASFGDPWGGWAYGPRYLIPSMAILAIFTLYSFQWQIRQRYSFLSRIFFFAVLSYSIAVVLLGAVTSNVLPPVVEAIPLNIKYGLPAAIQFMNDNISSVFMYRQFFSNHLTLVQYYVAVFIPLFVVASLLIFLPEEKTHEN